MRREEQEFDEAVSEVGSELLLVAGFGLLIPGAFFNSLYGGVTGGTIDRAVLENKVLTISRATSIILLVAFLIYVYFQMRYAGLILLGSACWLTYPFRSHHGMYDAVLEKDALQDKDRHKDLKKDKFTFTECIIAIVLALTFVTLSAEFLVNEIEHIVHEYHVSDAFMGLVSFHFPGI